MIAEALKKVQEEGGSGNFVIFETDTYYIQFAAEKGESRLFGEAVSNEFLPKKHALTDEQILRLTALGWGQEGGQNFSRIWYTTTDNERTIVAQEVMRAFEVYGVFSEAELQVNLQLE